MTDELGKRMKAQYEDRTRYFLPRRTYTIIRLDGKAFHTFTRSMKKPYDESLMEVMDETAKFLCENIQGCQMAYIQSDVISLLLTDFEKITTDAWFDGNIQKITSVSASIATAKFNNLFLNKRMNVVNDEGLKRLCIEAPLAFFDARVFTIPDPIEVENYFVWRQKDAVRNSIAMTAQSLYSHKELNKKSQADLQEMIFQRGQNWNDMPEGFKRGRIVLYKEAEWKIIPAIDILKEREAFRALIPKIII